MLKAAVTKCFGASATKGEKESLVQKETGFGNKTIGFVGGLSLLINNVTGPAMVTIPLVYQSAGWLTPTICLIVMTVLSSLASTFVCEAMACIPGNDNLQGRVEFSTLVSFFFGKKGLVIAQIFINISLQCANISAIIVCAQVADDAIIRFFGQTCGVELYPNQRWICVSTETPSDSPFDDDAYMLFTVGFILMMCIVIPMGMLNLDDNIIVQIAADVFLVVVTVDFLVTFILHGLDFSKIPAVGADQSQVLGNIMSNFAFITTIPSWCSEKKSDVSVHKSVWSATIISSISFFILGFFGALSFNFPPDSDVLSVINHSSYANIFTKILSYLFPLMILATTIPVFCIIVRYNLLQTNIVKSKTLANFFAVVLPWIVVAPFLTGNGLDNVINWGALIFGAVANFIIPFTIYIRAIKFRDDPSVKVTEQQVEIMTSLKLHGAGSVNADEIKTFTALPANFPVKPIWVARGIMIVFSVLVASVIGLNIFNLFFGDGN